MNHFIPRVVLLLALALAAAGCQSYVTPAGGVPISTLTDPSIGENLRREPASPFPARLAVVRVQADGYYSYSETSYGHGKFSTVSVRSDGMEKAFDHLARLRMINAVVPLNRVVIPPNLNNDSDLRLAASRLKADVLLVYTIDTAFRVDDTDIGPLGAITLGFSPNQTAVVTATASAALFDVRTGFIYGTAEASQREQQQASVWNSDDAVEAARLRAENKSLTKLLGEVETCWNGVIAEHVKK